MPSVQKPSKSDRLKIKKEQKTDLGSFRRIQSALAIQRDGNLCAICWFQHNRETPRADIHHVYGHGKKAGDWREHHTSLLCVCKSCHPSPIRDPGGNAALLWVEAVLAQANTTPINKKYLNLTGRN